MSPLTNLRINAALAGSEEKFDRELERRQALEVDGNASSRDNAAGHPTGATHGATQAEAWSGRLNEILEERLDLSDMDESDLRHAARVIRARCGGDPDMMALAAHVEGWELRQAEEAEERMARQMATESNRVMMEALGRDVPLVEQRTPIGNRDSKDQHPRTSAPGPYPTGVEPTAEPMSGRLRSMAGQVRRLAGLASSARQKNRLLQRASELEKMAVRQYEREGSADDPDQFLSFDSWSDKPGAADQIADDVQDQILDEDLPRVPAPGRRYAEDQLGSPAAGTDERPGARRNLSDDDLFQRLRKGMMSGFHRHHPSGGPGKAYSGRKRESMRESRNMTDWLLDELDVAAKSAHSWF